MTVTILHGDCRDVLKTLPSGSVHCVVTSPPYFGLRSYLPEADADKAKEMGLETTPERFVEALVGMLREARRVLRDDGSLWINIGDSYANDGKWGGSTGGKHAKGNHGGTGIGRGKKTTGLKPKDLIGIPWMVAFALRADGWYLRQDNIWHKPNPMPESVTDRCTKAHEYVFLLSKSQTYYYDADAIAEDQVSDHTAGNKSHKGLTAYEGGAVEHRTKAGLVAFADRSRKQTKRAVDLAQQHGLTEAHIAAIRSVGISDAGKAQVTTNGFGKNDPAVQALADEAKAALGGYYREFLIAPKRNKRSVWTVATKPFKEAHFATFPPNLIEPCILAGCPKGGTVLDPFFGAGTTGLVADRLGRNCVGIELNPASIEIARRRLSTDAGIFGEVT